ncbi:MAG: DUF58 domain-containing protein [Gemmataceae bacterium]
MDKATRLGRWLRKMHLRARRAVAGMLGGLYPSLFKGAGIVFEEVREYQPGDDVRSIDWHVTARLGRPFIKRFTEERERIILLAVDRSASMAFASGARSKLEAAAELLAFLAWAATWNRDRIGLALLTDRLEHFLVPSRGTRYTARILRDLLWHPVSQRRGELGSALRELAAVQRRRAVLVIASDFLDASVWQILPKLAGRHECLAVCVYDPLEQTLPPLGQIGLHDAETNLPLVLPARSRRVRMQLVQHFRTWQEHLRDGFARSHIDAIWLATDQDPLHVLVQFFQKHRSGRLRR